MAKSKRKRAPKKRPQYPTIHDPRNVQGRRISKYGRAMIERDQTVRDLRNDLHANERLLSFIATQLDAIEREVDQLVSDAMDVRDRGQSVALKVCNLRTVIKRPSLLDAHGSEGSREHG